MNPFDPDESPGLNNDLGAFEQQLRSLRPSPAAQSADSIAQSIEAPRDQPAVVTAGSQPSSLWQPVISHSLTAAIGVAVGVALVLARTPSDLSNSHSQMGSGDSVTTIDIADDQPSAPVRPIDSADKTPAVVSNDDRSSETNQQPTSPWRANRFSQASLNSGPLTAFGSINSRLARTNDWQTQSESGELDRTDETDGSDQWLDQSDERPADKPVLSPRSFDQFFDELTHAPGADVDFAATQFVVPALAGIFTSQPSSIPPEGVTKGHFRTSSDVVDEVTSPSLFRKLPAGLVTSSTTKWLTRGFEMPSTNLRMKKSRAEGPALILPSLLRAQS